MTSEQLTAEHIRRRIDSGVPRAGGATLDKPPQGQLFFETPTRPSLGLRLKTQIVENWLPRVNLTSYRSLMRSQNKWSRTAAERDRLAAELATVAAERDRLVQQTASDRERADREAEERAELVRELSIASGERDTLLSELQSQRVTLERYERELASAEAVREELAREVAAAAVERSRLEQKLLTERAGAGAVHGVVAQMHNLLTPALASLGALQQEVRGLRSRVPAGSTDRLTAALERYEALRADLFSRSLLHEVRELLERQYRADQDPNLHLLFEMYDRAEAESLVYWDVRAAVRGVSRHLRPQTYLEVGTRRGWSLAQAFAECPDVDATVFEVWEENYGSAEQGSPSQIRRQMQAIVGACRSPKLRFVDGNSHDTLPQFFSDSFTGAGGPLPSEFDLITIDGDHSRLGAWWDLCDLLPRVKVGGALVFDDLEYAGDDPAVSSTSSRYPRDPAPAGLERLLDVWLYVQMLNPNFLFLTCPTLRYRAGVAMRFA